MAIIVEDAPTPELLEHMEIDQPDTLFWLYEGRPLPDRNWSCFNALADRITIFQGPLQETSRNDNEVVVTIGETVIHEFGHYFGLSEEEIEEIKKRY